MAWAIEAFTAAGANVAAGLFIPATLLPGITADELDDTNMERKVALAIATQFYTKLSGLSDKLGLSTTKVPPQGSGIDQVDQALTFSAQYVVNHAARTVSMIPAPVSGVGQVTLEQAIGVGVAFVNAAAGVPAAGILIPDSLVTAYGGVKPVDVSAADARGWVAAIFYGMVANMDLTNAAVVVASVGSAQTFTPPSNYTGSGAITGLNAADLPLRSFFSKTLTLTLRLALDPVAQRYDLVA